jgi:hypothetical protein
MQRCAIWIHAFARCASLPSPPSMGAMLSRR